MARWLPRIRNGPPDKPSNPRRLTTDPCNKVTSFGNALIWAKGHAPETSAAFARARELASREEDVSERFSAYFGLWLGHLNRCEPAPMREMAELFLCEAAAQPDCPEAVIAHRISGVTRFYFGDFAGAHEHFQKTIKLYIPACHGDFATRFGHDPRAYAEIIDAVTLWVLGSVDEALRLADRALADAELRACSDDGLGARIRGVARAFAAQPGSSRDLHPSVGRYRVSLR